MGRKRKQEDAVMKQYAFGIDVGGTTVKMGFFTAAGELLEKWEIKTDTTDHGANVIPDVAAAIDGKLKERGISKDEVIGVGIDVPGPVDAAGYVRNCVNLGWDPTAAASAIDKAVAKGIIHKNKAARRKSRLARKINALNA